MDVLTLIASARDAGLSLDVEAGSRLTIKGPKSAADLARALGERKSEVVAALRLERISAPTISPDARFHDELACWPLAWREAWGWITNAIEDAWSALDHPTSGAGLAAFAAVSRLRGEGLPPGEALASIWDAWGLPGAAPVLGPGQDSIGGEFSPIEEHPTPEPFPEWNQLIDPRDYLPKPPPPRPLGSPTWGVTESIRVVELASWTPCRQAKDPVIKVTAEGWEQWFPVEPGDLPPTKEGIAAEASQNLFDWEAI